MLTDWASLWKDLVRVNEYWQEIKHTKVDHWENKARALSDDISKRWSKNDSSRAYVISRLSKVPGCTLLDIGAGTGAWAVLASPYVASITALDPSPAMIQVMRENINRAEVSNVQIIQGTWPDIDVEPHDFSLCAHAMYGVEDLPQFIRKMVEVTRQTCFLLMRAPLMDGLMAEFAQKIFGHPHDSPNFVVAYNTLIQMGIYANVLVEDYGPWKGWTNNSLEEALSDVKRRLGLNNNPIYDEYIYGRLAVELSFREGKYYWPRGVRTALIYWDVA